MRCVVIITVVRSILHRNESYLHTSVEGCNNRVSVHENIKKKKTNKIYQIVKFNRGPRITRAIIIKTFKF